tara:strand:- start:69108 stop:70415 length:1308 start_codon:yes stop_codon:yes gene_type:complete
MIGVGVYTTSGFAIAALGSPARVVGAWVIGGVIAICGAIGYASLASRFVESGGEYLFLARSLHPVAGMMAGWVSLLAGFTGAIAAAAIGLEEYLRPLFASELSWLMPKSIAIVAVIGAATIHAVGVRQAARTQDVIVLLKIVLIAGFIIYAATSFADRIPGSAPTPQVQEDPASSPLSVLALANQLVWISLSYAGFNAAVYLSSEIQDARRNVPRAMIGGTVLVTIIYVILNAIFVYATPSADIAGQPQVATLAAESIGGSIFAKFVGGVIVLSLMTSVSALVMTGPRVYAKMADDGLLPAWFRFAGRPPTQAIFFQAAFAILVILASSLKELIGYLGLTLSVCSALTVAMVFVLRWRGDLTRLPLGGIPALAYVAATMLIAVLSAIQQPVQAMTAGATLALGFLMFPLMRRRYARTARSSSDFEADDHRANTIR